MRIVTPSELGISGVNLKAVTTYPATLIFPAENHFQFMAVLTMTVAGGPGTTGLANWLVEIFRDEDATEPIGVPFVIATAIDTKTNATDSILTFGGAGADIKNGTIAAGASALKIAPFVKISLVTTEASDATTATGSVHLLAEGWRR